MQNPDGELDTETTGEPTGDGANPLNSTADATHISTCSFIPEPDTDPFATTTTHPDRDPETTTPTHTRAANQQTLDGGR